MVQATIEGEEVERLNSQVEVSSFDISSADCILSNARMASLLRLAVNNCNIEDLFPEHAWNEHQEESAAAAYHSLAALFIRFGDTESALECLKLSDQLEDSPRSLALKGIIAFDRGETLGAVANLVSSLQQYELRKKRDGNHYLSFTPSNLERINSNLNAGLQALNKRNNEVALEHFAQAVNDFDTFYSEYGVKIVK
jgi:tetratricopeptide (TPR) repeat protein